jgi:hypothetical protein
MNAASLYPSFFLQFRTSKALFFIDTWFIINIWNIISIYKNFTHREYPYRNKWWNRYKSLEAARCMTSMQQQSPKEEEV